MEKKTPQSVQKEVREEFTKKFGQFYVSINAKTKAIRIVDIINGLKVHRDDGSEIECVASGDIQKWLDSIVDRISASVREETLKEVREKARSLRIDDNAVAYTDETFQLTTPEMIEGWNHVVDKLLTLLA